MDEAVRRNVAEVRIVSPDRPHLVRAALGGGGYWSRAVQVYPQRPAEAPATMECMNRLPSDAPVTATMDGRDLLRLWLDLQRRWLATLGSEGVALEQRHASGAWLGPKVRLHPTARLNAPCWLGGAVEIGAGTEIGPYAVIGAHAVVDAGVTARDALVLPSTYVGPKVNLNRMIADGRTLLDAERGTSVTTAERFILASLLDERSAPGIGERLTAAALWLLAGIVSMVRPGGAVRETMAVLPDGETILLATRERGPLLVRRCAWLRAAAAGRIRLTGILPRSAATLAALPADVQAGLRSAPPGVVSLADMQGCHSPDDPEEWLHALYQAGGADPEGQARLSRAVWSVLWKDPA